MDQDIENEGGEGEDGQQPQGMTSSHGLKEGELAGWLKVIALAQKAGNTRAPVPPTFLRHLVTLRCITVSHTGEIALTDKGLLSLKMAEPGAWNI